MDTNCPYATPLLNAIKERGLTLQGGGNPFRWTLSLYCSDWTVESPTLRGLCEAIGAEVKQGPSTLIAYDDCQRFDPDAPR